MCVIIYKPKDKNLTQQEIANCYKNNSDGLGWMYVEDGRVVAGKFLPKTLEEVQGVFANLTDKEAVIHLRFKTTGDLTEAHAHPFRVLRKSSRNPDIFMMHNGTFKVTTKDGENDTIAFKNQILKPTLMRDHTLLDDDNYIKMLEGMDSWSRICFFTSEGKVYFTRKNQWVERSGCTLSNAYSLDSTHRDPTPTYSTPTYYGGTYNGSTYNRATGWSNNYVPQSRTTSVVPFKGKQESVEEEEDDSADIDLTPFMKQQVDISDSLSNMHEDDIMKWILEETDDAVNLLESDYDSRVVADWLAYIGLYYVASANRTIIEEWVDVDPDSVVDFIQYGYKKGLTNDGEFY